MMNRMTSCVVTADSLGGWLRKCRMCTAGSLPGSAALHTRMHQRRHLHPCRGLRLKQNPEANVKLNLTPAADLNKHQPSSLVCQPHHLDSSHCGKPFHHTTTGTESNLEE
jgi:hypothetical protein